MRLDYSMSVTVEPEVKYVHKVGSPDEFLVKFSTTELRLSPEEAKSLFNKLAGELAIMRETNPE